MAAPLPYPIQSIRFGGRAFTADYAFPCHVQAWHQLYVVLSGKISMWVEGRSLLLKKGDGLWMAPSLRREPRAASDEGLYLTVQFQSPWPQLGAGRGERVHLDRRAQAMARACAALVRGTAHEQAIAFHALCLHLLGPEAFSQLAIKPVGEAKALGERLVAQLEQIMTANVGAPLSIDDMASLAHVSRATLGRVFQAHRGVSPVARFRVLRLEKGLQLLRTSRLTITEIAHETGFSSSQHFATAFRRRYGHAPSLIPREQISYIARAAAERGPR